MINSDPAINESAADDVFTGGGEMGELMRLIDWSLTPLGPVAQWPLSVRLVVNICLTSRFPIAIWWGPELILQYNDAYRPMLGKFKHPRSMGRKGQEIWPEIWPVIGPMLESVLATGKATWSDNLLLFQRRNGYKEECYFTFSYSPIRNEQGLVDGIFTAVSENTEKVLAERRMKTLRDLGAQASQVKTVEDACRIGTAILDDNRADLPFSLLYLLNEDHKQAVLCASAGLREDQAAGPGQISMETPPAESATWSRLFARVVSSGQTEIQKELNFANNEFVILGEKVKLDSVLVVPLRRPGDEELAGLLVVGISPFLALDEAYQGFIENVAASISNSLTNARAYVAERKRAEVLAELDRAKTVFFNNISHEFRTPLTLMLGPLEDLLAQAATRPLSQVRNQLELIHRNSLRLHKLVNTLLDFSRIEAKRIQGSYVPTELASYTAELASSFRSAVERAGLALFVDCPPLSQPVWVDRDMWEKIVLNLLSNAFKFTFKGSIRVALKANETGVGLTVSDTGEGIAEKEQAQIFNRFQQVRHTRARTYEGSGIGLAMVKELVALHGGSIEVVSQVNQGSTFEVKIPWGNNHLPVDQLGISPSWQASGTNSRPFLEEALRWLPDELTVPHPPTLQPAPVEQDFSTLPALASGQELLSPDRHFFILIVDDNADMRQYLGRLLGQYYDVRLAADGDSALAILRQQVPDLILTDVMMPGLGGFALLQAVRQDPATALTSVIILSARAGEEARVEGLNAGADDYLIKPFSARELLARVATQLKLTWMRREVAEVQQNLAYALEAAQLGSWDLDLVTGISKRNLRHDMLWGFTELQAHWSVEAALGNVIAQDRAIFRESLDKAIKGGTGQFNLECRVRWPDDTLHWLNSTGRFFYNPQGQAVRMAGIVMDITRRKEEEDIIQKNNERFQIAEIASNGFIYEWNKQTDEVWRSNGILRVLGYSPDDIAPTSLAWENLIHPQDFIDIKSEIARLLNEKKDRHPLEYRVRHKAGHYLTMQDSSLTVYDEQSHPTHVVGSTIDITDRKRMEEALRASEERFRRIAQVTNDTIWDWNLVTNQVWWNEGITTLFGYSHSEIDPDFKWFENLIHPADRAEILAGIKAALESSETNWSAEYRFRQADGSYLYVVDRGYILYSRPSDGSSKAVPVRMVGAMLDLTRRKQKEAQSDFLIDFGEQLRPLRQEEEVFKQAATLLGKYLKVDRCYFAEINFLAQELTHHPDYRKSQKLESMAGTYNLAGFQLTREHRKTAPVMISDTTKEEIPYRFYRQLYQRTKLRSIIIIPMQAVAKGEPWLLIVAEYTRKPHVWQDEELALVKVALERVWLAAHNARLYLKASQVAVLEERNRIARNLHDSLQQDFFSIQLQADTLLTFLKRGNNAQLQELMVTHLQEIQNQSKIGLAGLRSLILGLRSEAFTAAGLVVALQNFLTPLKATYQLNIVSLLGSEPPLSAEGKEVLYWVAREAIFNTIKHSNASEIEVSLASPAANPRIVEMRVRDNGRGFDPAKVGPAHIGLKSMKERVQQVKGDLNITSKIGQGTTVVITIHF